jgi:hypothetical protein
VNASHVIARCSWQSALDHQARAGELQNALSRWSNDALADVLDCCFNERCPAEQVWRIDSLHLDIGDIAFEELADELPRRVRKSLDDALDQVLMNRHVSRDILFGTPMRIFDAEERDTELVGWFLKNGSLPWWFKGSKSALQILDAQIHCKSESFTEILRDLGRSAIVRKRLVRQGGEARVRRIIHLLEPWQGEFICGFADNLFVVQAERHLPRTGTAEYRQHTWLCILTWLLMDRGSLFNTTAFVRANLRQIAQHYHLDYAQLLSHLVQAVDGLAPLGLVTPVFITALKAIHRQDRADANQQRTNQPAAVDEWALMQTMLRGGMGRRPLGSDVVHIAELFFALAREDAERMAALLRSEGQSANVRHGLLQHFDFDGLAEIVQILEPLDQPFIVAYVHHAQDRAEQLGWEPRLAWKVVLAWLLARDRAHFNRRQLVLETLLLMCKTRRLELLQVLDVLIHTLSEKYASTRGFELLDVFQNLRNEQSRRQLVSGRVGAISSATALTTEAEQALLHYLRTAQSDCGVSQLGASLAEQGLRSLCGRAEETSLAQLLQAAELSVIRDAELSERLLKLAGLVELPLLFEQIQPGSADFILVLLHQLRQMRRQFGISSLGHVEFGFQLPAILLEALPGFRKRTVATSGVFDPAIFCQRLIRLLQQRCGADLSMLRLQLQQCLESETQTGADALSSRNEDALHALPLRGEVVLQALLAATTVEERITSMYGKQNTLPTSPAPVPTGGAKPQAAGRWMAAQLLGTLRTRLAMTAGPAGALGISSPMDLSQDAFWTEIGALDAEVVRQWLAQQPDSFELLTRLSREGQIEAVQHGLRLQLPADLDTVPDVLKTLSRLILKSGHWHGATARLEQQLEAIFWEVVLKGKGRTAPAGELLAAVLCNVSLRLDIPFAACLTALRQQTQLLQQVPWRGTLSLLSKRTFVTNPCRGGQVGTGDRGGRRRGVAMRGRFHQDSFGKYLHHPALKSVLRQLLEHGSAPPGSVCRQPAELDRLLFDVFTRQPERAADLLGEMPQQPEAMFRLFECVPFALLMDALDKTIPDRQVVRMLRHFEHWLQRLALPNIRAHETDALLFRIVLSYWLRKDWRSLTPEHLIPDFFWQLSCRRDFPQNELRRCLSLQLETQPTPIRLAFQKVIGGDLVQKRANGQRRNIAPASSARRLAETVRALREADSEVAPVSISNCGLVLLQSFIPTLLLRLGLTDEKEFVSEGAQRRAVHLLQFLVTGHSSTAEEYLALNKVLCGLALHEPLEDGIELEEREREMCLSLLQAMIGYWNAIGESSIDGLRGNWLVRSGTLNRAKDRWDLLVEKRVYDLLLARSPFSYSVIKFPWMEKPMYVTWPT